MNFSLDKVLTWDNQTLEYRHDYIQHLFPLPERSPINPDAPVITKVVRDAFLQRPELRENLQRAFARMCTFYGLKMLPTGEVIEGGGFEANAKQTWLTSRDHNHLRITKIVRCMRILGMSLLIALPPNGSTNVLAGLESEARKFTVALLDLDTKDKVSTTSATFWCRAALWRLEKPPSYPRDPEVKWLECEDMFADEETSEKAALDRHVARRRLSL